VVSRRRVWDGRLARQVGLALFANRFAAQYFAQLDTEYEALCPVDYREKTASTVEAFRDENARTPSWDLNHRYEYVVMTGAPMEVVRQRMDIYRERLWALAGPEIAAVLKTTFGPVASDGDDVVRRKTLGLLSEVQRFRLLRSEFDRLRNWLLVLTLALAVPFAAAFVYTVSQSFASEHAGTSNPSSVLLDVAVAGLFGGYFSVLTRVGSLRWQTDYAVNYQRVDKLFWNIAGTFCVSMFEGAVAALILYTVFAAGLVKGDLFPVVNLQSGTPAPEPALHEGLWHHFNGAPKLVVWSVLAGFSERLVPDFLSALEKKDRSATPAPPKPPSTAV
jgi:lipid-A-disaccharide synthase-like uncharacterized protein